MPRPAERRPAVAERIGGLLEQCRDETAAAARGLGGAPWFSLMAVLTLALGMTATSLTFTIVQGTLLRPLPVRDEGRLFVARKQLPSGTRTLWSYSRTEIDAVRASSRLLEDVAGVGWNDLGGAGAANVTGRFFEVLGGRAGPGPGPHSRGRPSGGRESDCPLTRDVERALRRRS